MLNQRVLKFSSPRLHVRSIKKWRGYLHCASTRSVSHFSFKLSATWACRFWVELSHSQSTNDAPIPCIVMQEGCRAETLPFAVLGPGMAAMNYYSHRKNKLSLVLSHLTALTN